MDVRRRVSMSRLVVQMLDRFPLMVPNREMDQYRGFLSAGEVDLYVHVRVPHLPTVKGMLIEDMSEQLAQATQDCHNEMQQWLSSNSRAFFDFLVWLQNLALSKRVEGVQGVEVPPLELLRRVVRELSALGDAHVASVDAARPGEFVLKTESAAGTHLMHVEALPDASFRAHCPDLPDKSARLVQQAPSIGAAFETLQQQVQQLQLFWRLLAEIDAQTCVLDPVEPSLAHTRRQIAIEGGFSVTIAVDPSEPLARPELSFLGPDSKVAAVEGRIRGKQWEVREQSLLASLRHLLGEQLAAPRAQEAPEASQEACCSVCFAAEALDRTCERCGGRFHEQCLLQWLHAVPANRTAFGRILGHCPLCKQDISCAI